MTLQHCRHLQNGSFHPSSAEQGDQHVREVYDLDFGAHRTAEALPQCRSFMRQTASEIGVTRNAVIGKMNRLGLSRPKDVIGRQLEQRRAARLARPKTPRTWRSKSPRLTIFAQHEMLTFRRPQPPAEDIPIYNGRGCTLLELS